MRTDARGLSVTCDSDAEVAAIDDFARRLARLATGTEAVLRAAERFPETPLLQLYAAAAFLFEQTAAGDRRAASYLERAAGLAQRANPREERLRTALAAWQRHAFEEAAAALEALTAEWPTDLLAAKLLEFLYYVLGQQHEAARFRRHAERLRPALGDDPDYLAMLAFACELAGDPDAAEATAERALALEPRLPWADHALSHVWLRRGATERALARLTAALPVWAASSRVIHAHNAWHLAVHHLDRLDFDSAEALLDNAVLRAGEEMVGADLDAIALLWRIELAGGDASARWQAIADRVEPHLEPCFMPFISTHFAYALARAGRAAALNRLLQAVHDRSLAADPDARRSWSGAGRALVYAAAAFGAGDASHAASLLAPVIDELTIGGGSDAQCDLFRQTYVAALAASGRSGEARAAVALLAARPSAEVRERLVGFAR